MLRLLMRLHCFPFILLELFISLNAWSDFKWAYLVFLSYLWNYLCLLMHAQILYWLRLFSFHTFGIIHVPKCMLRYSMGLACFPFILLELSMSLNACSDIKLAYIVFLSYFLNHSCPLMHAQILNGLTLPSFHTFGIIHVP